MELIIKKAISILLAITLISSANIISYAKEITTQQNNTKINEQLENNMHTIEAVLENQGTSVSSELKVIVKKLETDKMNAKMKEDKDKLQALINTTKKLETSYNNYNSGIMPRGISNPVLTPAIAAVATYFSTSGYLLSFELLVHAEDNNILNSKYIPYYGKRIQSSPIVLKIITSPKDKAGSASFEKGKTKISNDLYYAIHDFNYTFSRRTGKFNLTDRYDFEYGTYSGIAQAAVNTMWQAQIIGVLVPYYISITI